MRSQTKNTKDRLENVVSIKKEFSFPFPWSAGEIKVHICSIILVESGEIFLPRCLFSSVSTMFQFY